MARRDGGLAKGFLLRPATADWRKYERCRPGKAVHLLLSESDFGRSGFWRKRGRIENPHDALEDNLFHLCVLRSLAAIQGVRLWQEQGEIQPTMLLKRLISFASAPSTA
jgi:hypothetical protein